MLEADSLCMGYPRKSVIHNASLSLNRGDLVAVLGSNGSGKSTLLKTLAGLLPPKAGHLHLEGRELAHYSSRVLAQKIAFHGQHHEIPDMDTKTLLDHSRFPYQGFIRQMKAHDVQAIERAVERMQLESVLTTPLKQLSGGYQQRAYLALTLAREAEYLLFDEPDSHLDISQKLILYQLLEELADEGHCVVASLHDLPEALRIANRILLLNEKAVIFDGTPQEAVECGILETTFSLRITTQDGFYRFSLR
ncbi:MAG: ABC transporter ATP-binding protein [Sphaerochaeta sp.]